MQKYFKVFVIGFVLLSGVLNLNISINSNEGEENITSISIRSSYLKADDETSTCKWQIEECTSGTYRDICTSDGDGNSCTCGNVTRSC